MKNLRKMELPIQDILRYIIGQVTPDRSVLVGIDGGAGSGKTTFARWLAENVRQTMTSVSIVHTDNFYRPSAERVNTSSRLRCCLILIGSGSAIK